jgi:hypothetical protein
MNTKELFSDSAYANQMHIAESELSAFLMAVQKLYGPEQARMSAENWVDEADLLDSPPLSTARNWRAVTVAASARLATRLSVAGRLTTALTLSTDGKATSSDDFIYLFSTADRSRDFLIGLAGAMPQEA